VKAKPVSGRPDFEAEGLLESLEGEARRARLDLLEHLYDEGVSLDELRRAVEEERLVLLPVERVIAEEQKYTATEVARQAGIDRNLFLAQRRAAGLPTPPPRERAFSDEDLESARRLAVALELGFPKDKLLEGARVFGRAAAQAATASRVLAAEAFVRPGDTERDVALRIAEAARTLHPQTAQLLQRLYNSHLREQLRNDVVAAELASGRLEGAREVTVCFADLVGFTTLGEEMAVEDLGEVADRFTKLAAEVAEPPVALIKTIGDAAMLVSPEPDPLLEAALTLVERSGSQEDGLPELKAGVAMGEALNRFGDWYGRPVNVASRVTAIAKPASVLATGDVRVAASDRFVWSEAGHWRLKGIRDDVPLYRCRRERPPRFRRRGRRR
jgi:adenylate cyclase